MMGFALGWAGLTVVLLAWTIIGAIGSWKIKLSDTSVIIVAFLTGQAAANAGETFAAIGQAGGGLSSAIREGFGSSGANFTAGAAALLMILIIYGLKPNKYRNAFFGLVLPSMFTATGGIFAVVTRTLNGLLGVAA
jgi:hypothetical protein